MGKRQGHFLLINPGKIPCAEVFQLHEQCGAFMQCHGFPVASAERTFQGPKQVEAGLLPDLAHGHKGGHGAQRTQCCGGANARSVEHALRRWAQVGQGSQRWIFGWAGGHGRHDGGAWQSSQAPTQRVHRRPAHNPQQQMRGRCSLLTSHYLHADSR